MENDSNTPESVALLRRILAAVEKERRTDIVEVALIMMLALTALASTWCAYQSQLWNSVQSVRLADAELSNQEAQENALMVMERRTLDGLVMFNYMNALHARDMQMAEAIHRRMPSPLRETIDAWLKLDPLNNPDVPPPGKMPQYVLPEDALAKAARDEARGQRAAAERAGNNGDTYVLLTLMFAAVLFFGGITGTFAARRIRVMLSCIACALFLTTVCRLYFMPVTGW